MLSAILFTLGLSCLNLEGATGIFITKKSTSHPDSTAKVIEYNTVTRAGPVTYFVLPSGQRFKVNKFQLMGIYPYVNPKVETIRASERDKYSRLLRKYEAVSARYSQAKPLLKRQLEVLREVVRNLQADRGWHEGKWIPEYELDAIIAEKQRTSIEQLKAEARERAERRKQEKIAEVETQIEKLEARPERFDVKRGSDEGESLKSITTQVDQANSLSSTLTKISSGMVDTLREKQIPNLAVSRVYYNGLGDHPFGNYLQRKILGEFLEQAAGEISILERTNLRVQVRENKLQWLTGGQSEGRFLESQALMMGEFLHDPNSSQALLAVRIIDTNTAAIIASKTEIVDLDPRLLQRLQIPKLSTPKAPFYQPSISLDQNSQFLKALRSGGPWALATIRSAPEDSRFVIRVFQSFLVTQLVDAGAVLLEREFLHQIADERGLVDRSLDSLENSSGILEIEHDESSPASRPGFFVKAIHRKSGALSGQIEAGLISKELSQEGGPVDTVAAGSLDGLAAAVANNKEAAKIGSSSDLKFRSVVRFKSDKPWPDKDAFLVKSRDCYLFDVPSHRSAKTLSLFFKDGRNAQESNELKPIKQIRETLLKDYLERIIALENEDLEGIRASLLSSLLVGIDPRRHWTEHTEESYYGPLHVIFTNVSSTLTINRDRSASHEAWQKAEKWFSQEFYKSVHPRKKSYYQENMSEKSGSFEPIAVITDPAIRFNYVIETEWTDALPDELALTIDFSPMKDKIYRVK